MAAVGGFGLKRIWLPPPGLGFGDRPPIRAEVPRPLKKKAWLGKGYSDVLEKRTEAARGPCKDHYPYPGYRTTHPPATVSLPIQGSDEPTTYCLTAGPSELNINNTFMNALFFYSISFRERQLDRCTSGIVC